MSDRMDLRNPKPGRALSGAVVVRSLDRRVARSGKPYMTVVLANATGQIETKVWSEQLDDWAEISPGTPLRVEGEAKEGWNGRPPELDLRQHERLPADHPVALELNPVSQVPLLELTRRYQTLVGLLERQASEMLVDAVTAEVGWRAFCEAPAAARHHHATVHGLLEHSVEVAEIAVHLCESLPRLDQIVDLDDVIVGALMHDVAKIREYRWRDRPIEYSPSGRWRYHTSSGPEITAVAVARLASAQRTEELLLRAEHLKHVQESHHSTREWGSPTAPKTIAAQIIHLADLVSARTRAMQDALETWPIDDEGWVLWRGAGTDPVHDPKPLYEEAVRRSFIPPRRWSILDDFFHAADGDDHAA